MAHYWVNTNAQATGEHEVHRDGCPVMPLLENRKHLGDYDTCRAAVAAATYHFSNVDGCAVCSPECHTR